MAQRAVGLRAPPHTTSATKGAPQPLRRSSHGSPLGGKDAKPCEPCTRWCWAKMPTTAAAARQSPKESKVDRSPTTNRADRFTAKLIPTCSAARGLVAPLAGPELAEAYEEAHSDTMVTMNTTFFASLSGRSRARCQGREAQWNACHTDTHTDTHTHQCVSVWRLLLRLAISSGAAG